MTPHMAHTAGLAAAFLLLLGLVLGVWQWRIHRRRVRLHRYLDGVLLRRQFVVPKSRVGRATFHPRVWLYQQQNHFLSWLETPAGQHVIAQEDKALLAQCGLYSRRGTLLFLSARLGAMLLLPLALWIWSPGFFGKQPALWLFGAVAVGYLSPKWCLRNYAGKRRKKAEEELPLLVDLFGLLQGSGQGVDQSLHLIAQDFQQVLPVLSRELLLANRLYASGRTRDQAFSRMSEMFRSSNLADLTALLVQIDKHGGAVQEPLREFGERLREQRRMQMKENVGKVTVKMTGVMIVTLLPALMVITAGPGFIALMRSLGSMK